MNTTTNAPRLATTPPAAPSFTDERQQKLISQMRPIFINLDCDLSGMAKWVRGVSAGARGVLSGAERVLNASSEALAATSGNMELRVQMMALRNDIKAIVGLLEVSDYSADRLDDPALNVATEMERLLSLPEDSVRGAVIEAWSSPDLSRVPHWMTARRCFEGWHADWGDCFVVYGLARS